MYKSSFNIRSTRSTTTVVGVKNAYQLVISSYPALGSWPVSYCSSPSSLEERERHPNIVMHIRLKKKSECCLRMMDRGEMDKHLL